MKRNVGLLSMSLVLLLMVGCGEKKTEIIQIDGSSTVYPITEAVAEEFKKQHPEIRVSVGISGTGGGFKKFCRGEIDIANASRPIMPAEMEECKKNGIEFIELPIAYDGLTVVVHPKNDWVDYMTVSELRKLWSPEAEGKITKWNQIRPEWPDQEIHLYGAGTASGTFDYFTEAIVGEAKKSRGDYTSSEDDNVLVQGVSSDPYALGYFGLAYYEANQEKLKVVPIDDEDSTNGSGAILPTYDNIVSGLYQPLSRPLFIYVNRKALEKPHVKQFVQFYLDHAAKLAKETGYVALPDTAYKLAKERVEQLKTGSLFFNAKPGMKIETLLQKEAIQ